MTLSKRWPLYLLLIVVGVPGIRFAWRLSVSDTGWTPHLEQWASVAISLVGVEQRKLSDRDPEEQAKFWLSELAGMSERGESSDDPEMALGAAWMLDAPQSGFVWRHVRMKDGMDVPGLPASWRRELDEETIAALTEEFEQLCRSECLARIERAVQLDGADVELHRARALLLFQFRLMSLDSQPRHEHWLSVLDECAQADPDNALYDYLAALHLWKSSAEYDWDDDGYILNVADQGQFEQGDARLAAGLRKPHLRFGTEGYAATVAFFKASSAAQSGLLNATRSRQIDSRATGLLYRIVRWQTVQSDVEKRAGLFEAAVARYRRVFAISEQVTESGNSSSLLTAKWNLRRWSLANLKVIYKDHPSLGGADEGANVSRQLAEVWREAKILEEVGRRMAATPGRSDSEVAPGTTPTFQQQLLLIFLMAIAQMLVVVCVSLALVSSLISLLVGSSEDADQVQIGWGPHIVAWLFAVGSSFVLLGMFPAQIVSASAQTWLISAALWIGFGLVLLGLLYSLRRWFEVPLRQLVVLAVFAALPIIVLLHAGEIIDLAVAETASLPPILSIGWIFLLPLIGWASCHCLWKFVKNHNLARRRKLLAVGIVCLIALVAVPAGTALRMRTLDMEPQAWIRPIVWNEAQGLSVTASELRSALQLDDSKWAWAVIQWQTHNGPLIAPVIAVLILMVWRLIRRSRRVDGGFRRILRSQKRSAIRQSGKSMASSCLIAALVCLALYFVTTPPAIDMMDDANDQVQFARIVRPDQTWDEIAELTAKVKSDPQTMARLQAEIDERNRRLAEQEATLQR